jgi:isopenicillin N synthase-like dioxygenase
MSSMESDLSNMVPKDQLAHLQTISLHDLQVDSPSEQKRLLQTCINDGFFYLDVRESTISSRMSDIDTIFDLSKQLFDYSPEVKSLFDVDRISPMKTNGYKPKGRNVVGNGKKDGFESWVVSRLIHSFVKFPD